jgi:hypothetical protein
MKLASKMVEIDSKIIGSLTTNSLYVYIPSFDDDEGEEEEAEKGPEADDEGDGDGMLALDVEGRCEGGEDRAVLGVIDGLLAVGREPSQPVGVPLDEAAAAERRLRGVVGFVDADFVGVVVIPLHDLQKEIHYVYSLYVRDHR